MKKILLILVALATTAHAQLGWTRAQCEKHYGTPHEDKGNVSEFRSPVHGLSMVLEIYFNEEGRVYKIEYFTGKPGRLPPVVVNAILEDNASRLRFAREELNLAWADHKFYDSLVVSVWDEIP